MIPRKPPVNLLARAGRRAPLAGAVALLATLTVPLVAASASVPNSVTGAINACVKNQGGAVRVIDLQTGDSCAADERTLSWPGVGGAATHYSQGAAVNLSHDAGQLNTVLLGPVLPAGIWNATMSVTLVNNTGTRDTLRCALVTGGGSIISGVADNHDGAVAMTVPGLVTLTSPERINIGCSHDHGLPAGPLLAIHGNVVAEQMTSRF
ncbi:hypothetical protein AB0C24_10070 [Amycolatopsis japonica]|uniref:hypothetical protein n=1 Tax=Amycolatopsis japonica TaxID=208439 RepID=UPI0033C3D5AC